MKRILKVVAFLFFACVVLGVIASFLSPKAPPATPTATPAQVAPTDTSAPAATDTSAPPTIAPAIPADTSAPAPTARPAGYIERGDIGEKWPLTVESGLLKCARLTGGVIVVILQVGEATYAINGSARSPARMAQFGWMDIDEIHNKELDATGLLKYPLTPLLDKGLALCG